MENLLPPHANYTYDSIDGMISTQGGGGPTWTFYCYESGGNRDILD